MHKRTDWMGRAGLNLLERRDSSSHVKVMISTMTRWMGELRASLESWLWMKRHDERDDSKG